MKSPAIKTVPMLFANALLAGVVYFALGCQAEAADSVLFTYKPPQVSQKGEHQTDFSLNLNITYRQAGQLVMSDSKQVTRQQVRQVTVLEVADEKVMKVQVAFPKAVESMATGKQKPLVETQPIEGKQYIVERRDSELAVTDEHGKPVPERENALVAGCMDAVGRTSPLGKFLNGKRLTVGQSIYLPIELATQLLGTKEAGGEAKSVALALAEVKQEKERRLATFAMQIVLKLSDTDTINIQGSVQVDADTCQVLAADFTGPVSTHETQMNTASKETFESTASGTMKVAMRSQSIK